MKLLESRFLRQLQPGFQTHVTLADEGYFTFGYSVVRGEESYVWNGLKRGGDQRHPVFLFQHTLSGFGIFETDGKIQHVPTGNAFCAGIPGPHLYRNCPDCKVWTFFWIMVRHPYMVSRLLNRSNLVGAVIEAGVDSPAIRSAAALFFELGEGTDKYDAEAALIRWMLELERLAFRERHPEKERECLLQRVKSQVLARIERFIAVDELAHENGMSRSNFTHHFLRVTGLSPASFIRDLRLREAIRLMGVRTLSVKEIAAQTGFANTNHLCKCFRARFQISPGVYRRSFH